MLRLLIALGLMAMTLSAYSLELTNFDQIREQLLQGKSINYVIQSNLCKITDPNVPNIPTSNLLLKPDTVVFTDQYISVEGNRFLPTPKYFPFHVDDLVERGTGLIDNTGNAKIKIIFYDAKTNEKSKILKPVLFECELNNGVRAFI